MAKKKLSAATRAALPQEAQDYIASLEEPDADDKTMKAALADKEAEITRLTEALKAAKPEVAEAEALKELSPAAREMVLKAKADTAEALKVATEEREKREMGEAITAAKALSTLGKPDDLGPALRRIKLNRATADDLALLDRTLAGAAERVAKSKLFGEIGSSDRGGETGTARDEVLKRAADLRKADPKLSDSKAFTQALASDTELAKRYRAEQAH